ncbi:MAG: hypothetical protein SFU27_02060 [Thermonemataceae bacterium]|nr:hypothetical protein [Thermonemataceae bacterium]
MSTKITKKQKTQLSSWKNKAKKRGQELRAMRKRLQELEESRDYYKTKLKAEKEKSKRYETALKNSEDISEPVKNHSYNLQAIFFCLALKMSGVMSLRCCRSALITFYLHFNIPGKVPCINTIRIWEQKTGYNGLQEKGNEADDYMLIIDESFNIGKQSMLIVLAVNLKTYKFGKSLAHQDVKVVSLNVKPSWKAEDIAKVVEDVERKSYRVKYVCSDGGNNIVKAFENNKIKRVYDCTHALCLLLKKRYKDDSKFISFQKKYTLMNRQNYMGQDRIICPQKLKGKCRFLNIYPIAEWAEKHLNYLQQIEKKKRNAEEQRLYTKLLWLREYQDLVKELVQVSAVLKGVFEILKTEGLDDEQVNLVTKKMELMACPMFLREGILVYLEQNNIKIEGHSRLICCSDIIESFFGKFKYNQKRSPEKGVTIGCLDLVNYGQKIDKTIIKKAMEETKIIDLELWRDKNKLESFNNKRRKLFKKWG